MKKRSKTTTEEMEAERRISSFQLKVVVTWRRLIPLAAIAPIIAMYVCRINEMVLNWDGRIEGNSYVVSLFL